MPTIIAAFMALTAALPVAAQEARTIHTRDLNKHYEFPGYDTRAEWEAWADYLRRHILVSTGLWPLPERGDLRPEVFGRIERDGYSVEKVYFRSYPGFLVTGNLYRPLGREGPFPGIITPHGHWSVGRLANEERGSVPGRCINLARQGAVVFTYDMVGYNDSTQLEHRETAQVRELWGMSLMGLQLWNSMRAIDFLQDLPDVDPERIGCTGASGGGTQTFMVMPVDERVTAAAPVNMVSAHMQGGCLCENSPNLRVDTFNTEIAGLMAPRPLLLVAATGDWTKNTPTEEAPDVRSIYALYDAEERFDDVQFDAEHNYNQDSREAVYAFFGKWLMGIDDAAALKEQTFEMEKNEDLLVFADRDRPDDIWQGADAVLAGLKEASEGQLAGHTPKGRDGLRKFRKVYGSSLAHCLNLLPPKDGAAVPLVSETVATEPYTVVELSLRGQGTSDRIPATLISPTGVLSRGPSVVVVSDRPRRELLDATRDAVDPLVAALLDKGRLVLLVDAFLIGDNQLSADSERDLDADFFTVYNRTDTALRVADILTALRYIRTATGGDPVSLVGLGEAGPWCLLASAGGARLTSVAVDMNGLDATSDEQLMERIYTPGLRRAGDIRTAAALWAPSRLLIHNLASGDLTLAQAAYRAADSPKGKKLRIEAEPVDIDTITSWVAP